MTGVAKVCNGTDMHTLYMHDILVYFYKFTSEVNLNGKKTYTVNLA